MKIIIGVDGSKYSLAATEKCCEILSIGDDSEVRIVCVADVSRPVGIEPFGISNEYNLTINNELKKMAKTFVQDAENIVREKVGEKVSIETRVLGGSPKSAIVEQAEKWNADMIVVGSHGYGFFERMLIGSVSDAILHHSPCSVLVVKSEEIEDSEK